MHDLKLHDQTFQCTYILAIKVICHSFLLLLIISARNLAPNHEGLIPDWYPMIKISQPNLDGEGYGGVCSASTIFTSVVVSLCLASLCQLACADKSVII